MNPISTRNERVRFKIRIFPSEPADRGYDAHTKGARKDCDISKSRRAGPDTPGRPKPRRSVTGRGESENGRVREEEGEGSEV